MGMGAGHVQSDTTRISQYDSADADEFESDSAAGRTGQFSSSESKPADGIEQDIGHG